MRPPRRPYRFTQRLLVLALIGLFVPVAAFAQANSNQELTESLQDALDQVAASSSVIGVSAAVQFADDSIWSGVAGSDQKDVDVSMSTDHLFGFASITKTYVAATVMKLVEEGILDLEDTVGDWIAPVQFVNSNITVRQLLNHSSGVYNYTNHPALISTVWADPNREWTPREILNEFLGPPMFFAGTGATYSNSNFHLSHLIVESATGETFRDVLHSRLLDPLGLEYTFFPPWDTLTEELATTWVDISGNGQLEDFKHLFDTPGMHMQKGAAGGMVARTSDIARWARHLFKGDVLSESSLSSMKGWINLTGQNSTWTGYGLGIMRYQFGDLEVWGHSGLIHGSRSLMVYSPDLDVSVVVVDNSASVSTYALISTLLQRLSGFLWVAVEHHGLPDRSDYTLDVFPNPVVAASRVSLQWNSSDRGLVRAELFDVRGQRVHAEDFQVGLGQAQVAFRLPSTLVSGVYFIRTVYQGRTIGTRSFVVGH